MQQNYFDYAAATPMLPEVVEAMLPYYSTQFYNPSAVYLAAQSVKKDMHAARARVAIELGAKPTEIIFTAGGTEANNLAITGVASRFTDAHIVTTPIEHDSVLQPAMQYAHDFLPVNSKGSADVPSLKTLITDNTVLVSIMLANNEIGTIQDVKEAAKIVTEVKKERMSRGISRPLYLHTDACQAVNYLDIHVSRLGVDMLTLNSGKIYGPKQMGALFIKTGTQIAPIIRGGGQERDIRSGTENVANSIGFAAALTIVRKSQQSEVERLGVLQQKIINELVDEKQIKLNGATSKRRLVNNIHLTIDGVDNERLLMELDEAGIMVATGSACSASNDTPSHVLQAIGLSDKQSRSSIRITLGRYTTIEQCDNLIKSIKDLIGIPMQNDVI
jgi:cysteine desulfurase